jgi:hypothetical protein
MEILTDMKHGDEALPTYLGQIEEEWEFVATGAGSESPYHQWNCSFYLGHGTYAGKQLYVLKIADFVDPDGQSSDDEDGTSDDYPEALEKVVAIWIDPPTHDEDKVVRTLLDTYQEHGGKYISAYDEVGRFDLFDD